MIGLQNCKVAALINPVLKDNGAVTTAAVDCAGYDTALAIIQLGAVDIQLTALKLTESDNNSSYSDVSGADFNGSTTIDGSAASLPDANASNTIRLIQIDLRKRKRYLKLSATVGDGTTGAYISGALVLGNAEQSPSSSTECGAAAVLRV